MAWQFVCHDHPHVPPSRSSPIDPRSARAGRARVGNVPLTRVSQDPFTNPTSQHATEVEPDTFAFGSTVVAAYQVGRFFNGGATDIGFARSTDGGSDVGRAGLPAGLTATPARRPAARTSA